MFKCHHCGHAAHTRSSRSLSNKTVERYYQCQNINCSATFGTKEFMDKEFVTPNRKNFAEPHPDDTEQLDIAYD
nr:ogr/Delta-like zinc finger family protein [Enterobacter ludwigii]